MPPFRTLPTKPRRPEAASSSRAQALCPRHDDNCYTLSVNTTTEPALLQYAEPSVLLPSPQRQVRLVSDRRTEGNGTESGTVNYFGSCHRYYSDRTLLLRARSDRLQKVRQARP